MVTEDKLLMSRQRAKPGRIIANKAFWYGYYSVQLPVMKGTPPFARMLQDQITEFVKSRPDDEGTLVMTEQAVLIVQKYKLNTYGRAVCAR